MNLIWIKRSISCFPYSSRHYCINILLSRVICPVDILRRCHSILLVVGNRSLHQFPHRSSFLIFLAAVEIHLSVLRSVPLLGREARNLFPLNFSIYCHIGLPEASLFPLEHHDPRPLVQITTTQRPLGSLTPRTSLARLTRF